MALRFTCYFPAEEPLFFLANVDPDDFITTLREAIHQKLKDLGQDVPLKELSLYKTTISLDPSEDLTSRARQFLHDHQEEHLDLAKEVAEALFPNPPRRQLHVLAATPEVLEFLETLGDPEALYGRKIRKDLDEKLARLPSRTAPSDVIKDAVAFDTLLERGQIYRNQVPVALFNDALGRLEQRLEKNDAIVDEVAVYRAHDYITRATAVYRDEESRQGAIKPNIEEVLGSVDEWDAQLGWAGDIKPGACWFYGTFTGIVLELKNVPGISGDPIFQCIADLSRIIPSAKYKDFRGSCNFPVVLIGLAGSRLHISIAVYVGGLFVSDLLTLDLSRGFHGSATTIRLARIFQALSLCRQELQGYYAGIHSSSRFDASFLYPHPITANTISLPTINYDKYLGLDGSPIETAPDLGQRCTAIYTGSLEGGERVLIKFTHHYNKEAHDLLAKVGLAPKLRFCNPVVGGVLMVVMDCIPEAKSVRQFRDEGLSLQPVILGEVERAVSLLHNGSFVFGDLRDGNILYFKDQGGEERVMLVDFDWTGIDGVSRYSATLNRHGEWADGVCPYGVMKKEHDLWQIKRLKELITGL